MSSTRIVLIAVLVGISSVACDDAPQEQPAADVVESDTADVVATDTAIDTNQAADEGAADAPAEDLTPGDPDVQPDVPVLPDVPKDVAPDPGDAPSDGEASDLDVVVDGSETSDGGMDPDAFFNECEELGIADQWAGTWEGALNYNYPDSGIFYPDQGSIPVWGTLGFGITCIGSKFMVKGQMSGEAEALGEEPVPFTLGIVGYYDPATHSIDADIVDGVVVIFEVFEFYFEAR